jgi:hypothetical protein
MIPLIIMFLAVILYLLAITERFNRPFCQMYFTLITIISFFKKIFTISNISYVAVLCGNFAYIVYLVKKVYEKASQIKGISELYQYILTSDKIYQEFATFATLLGLLYILHERRKEKK